jgi:hypothetical protein
MPVAIVTSVSEEPLLELDRNVLSYYVFSSV